MDLWKKQSEEEVSLKVSFNPTKKDLVSLTEEPPKMYYDSTAKEEESEEEVNQSRYFDAENPENVIPSPKATWPPLRKRS